MFVFKYVNSPEEWVSPITSSLITAGTVKLAAVTCGPDGAVCFAWFSMFHRFETLHNRT